MWAVDPAWFGGVLFVFLFAAAFTDIRNRTIPNIIPILVIVLYVLGALVAADISAQLPARMISFAVVSVVGMVLFATGIMGGGDIKLLAALSLWIPFAALFDFFVWVSGMGALVSLYYVLRAKLDGQTLLQGAKTPVPYGVAIFLGHIAFLNAPIFAASVN